MWDPIIDRSSGTFLKKYATYFSALFGSRKDISNSFCDNTSSDIYIYVIALSYFPYFFLKPAFSGVYLLMRHPVVSTCACSKSGICNCINTVALFDCTWCLKHPAAIIELNLERLENFLRIKYLSFFIFLYFFLYVFGFLLEFKPYNDSSLITKWC